jgi:hypothetical protein
MRIRSDTTCHGTIGQSYSMLSVIDTTAESKLSDISIEGNTLEALALDNYRPRIYLNDKATNKVVVIDRFRNSVIAKWPITLGKQNVGMALDEQRQRLFVGCRSGEIVVLDSNMGKELQTLPITAGIDDLVYDPITRRIYAASKGVIDVFEQTDLNHYVPRGTIATGTNARTAKLAPQLHRLFVAVPQAGQQAARILVYEPVNTPEPKLPPTDIKKPVNAPAAEKIVLETLSVHPLLRRRPALCPARHFGRRWRPPSPHWLSSRMPIPKDRLPPPIRTSIPLQASFRARTVKAQVPSVPIIASLRRTPVMPVTTSMMESPPARSMLSLREPL